VSLSILLDALIVALLVVTIVYAVILNRRMGALRDQRTEFEKLLAGFDESTKRAEASVKNLKSSAEQQMKAMQQPLQRAEAMRDELAFIVRRADELADRLSNAITNSRGAVAEASARSGSGAAESPREASRDSGRELSRESGREHVAEQRIGIAGAGRQLRPAGKLIEEPAAETGDAPVEGGRSKAETDLMKALRGLR
jgi:hypothetical protein